MVQQLRNTLSQSAAARWFVLALVSFMMLCGYFVTDLMAPLKPLLEAEFGWSSSDYGFFTSAYGWFNVFLLMLIVGGIILDRMGVRFTGVMSLGIMIVGVAIKYWGIHAHEAGETVTLLRRSIGAQLLWTSIGFATFAVGIEIAGITVSKIIVKWFKGRELALAMGLNMACSRLGTALALGVTPLLVEYLNSVGATIMVGLALLCVGLIAFVVFVVMDKQRDGALAAELSEESPAEDSFRLRDLLTIVRIRAFWYIAILCVLFYSAVFPFLKYAPDLMFNKFGLSEQLSGVIPALLPFGTILLTPIFGNLYDRKGRGASIMLLGAALIVVVHLLFALPLLSAWWMALILILTLGVAFSLVPSAMWPSVPKLVPEKQLGSAYALIFWIQNWGLMGVPLLIGTLLDKYGVIETPAIAEAINQAVATELPRVRYDYTVPMLVFAALGVLAIVFAYLLRREDARKGYGLERPNVETPAESQK